MEAFSRFRPVAMLRLFCSHGARTIIPMNPRTMEGKNPISSIITLKKLLSLLGAISAVNMARATAIGSAIRLDKSVADKVPAIRGSIPSAGGSSTGYQSRLRNISDRVDSLSTGIPFVTKNPRIKSIIRIPTMETERTRFDMILSPLPPKPLRIFFCRSFIFFPSLIAYC
jgi:hypothetical protein